MNELNVSTLAHSDLDDIWCYIAQDDPVVADRLLALIAAHFDILLSFPRLGRRRPEFGKNVYGFCVRSFLIVYSHKRSVVEIVRVIRTSRNIARLFHGLDDNDQSD